jgi:hypothetical protein
MRGAIPPPHPQYFFMAWCSVKSTGTLPIHLPILLLLLLLLLLLFITYFIINIIR